MVLLLGLALVLSAPARARGPEAVEILRRAEEVRSPDIDYAARFTLGVLDQYTPGVERKTAYRMIAHGKNSTLALMLTPSQFFGGTLLITHGEFWLLLPRAEKAFQLTGAQVLRGDISNGDLARANLLESYDPRLEGEGRIDGERCWGLDLTRTRTAASYPRLRVWVSKKGFLPKKLEYYGMTGALLKTARYGEFRKGPIGLRPMRIELEEATGTGGKTTMIFSDLRKIDASQISFRPEGMARFRDAAFAARKPAGDEVDVEGLLAALGAEKN